MQSLPRPFRWGKKKTREAETHLDNLQESETPSLFPDNEISLKTEFVPALNESQQCIAISLKSAKYISKEHFTMSLSSYAATELLFPDYLADQLPLLVHTYVISCLHPFNTNATSKRIRLHFQFSCIDKESKCIMRWYSLVTVQACRQTTSAFLFSGFF